MEKLRSRNRIIYIFVASLALTYVAFSCFYNQHYSIDAFATYLANNQNASWHIQNGRFVYVAVVYAVDLLGLNLVTDNVLWVSLFILVLTFSISTLTIRITKYVGTDFVTEIFAFLFVCLSFVQVFIAEWFQFTECLLMYSISVFFSVVAVLFFPLKSDQNKFGYIISLVSLTIAYNCYQAGICFFVFYVLCLIFLKNKGCLSASAVKSTISAAFAVVFTFVVNIIGTKLLIAKGIIASSSRVATISLENVWQNILQLLSKNVQSRLWIKGNGMFQTPDLLVLFLIMLAAALFVSISSKKKWYDVVFAFVLLSGGILAFVAPLLLTETFWMAPRSIVSFFCIYAYLGCMVAKSESKRLKLFLCFVLVVVLARQTWFIKDYSADILKSNTYDKIWTEYVVSEIENYEENNNLTVTQVGFSRADTASLFWDDIHYGWDVGIRAIVVDWARNNMVTYYTGRHFEAVPVPEEVVSSCMNSVSYKNVFDTQVVFHDNTCYIMLR